MEKSDRHFQRGGRLKFLHPLWEGFFTFMFTPSEATNRGPHVRDSIDLKRVMIVVVAAVTPAAIFGIYNAGYQSAQALGIADQLSHQEIFANGLWIVLPIILVSYAVGGFWEVLFASVRKHPISEGFLVTGILFPLILPPTIPLWQVAVGVSFGVVIGKEIFGGVGMNILNPALTGRAFLFFSYPADISGADPWVLTVPGKLLYTGTLKPALVDGFSGATPLLRVADDTALHPITQFLQQTPLHDYSWTNMFLGFTPGSIGETSALMCLVGALILLLTGVGSWRIMLSVVAGGVVTSLVINQLATPTAHPLYHLPPQYHLVMGGFMFGAVFMATDPVSATATTGGKYIYGWMIGTLTILIRTFNPAYPEGMMLSILFMNIFAPLIDHFVMRRNIKRRMKRAAVTG